LASSLAYAELLYQAMQVNSITFRPMEVYTTIAVMYFVVLFAASTLMRLVEHGLTRRG
jgi:polar amino acid transport system permease protein